MPTLLNVAEQEREQKCLPVFDLFISDRGFKKSLEQLEHFT